MKFDALDGDQTPLGALNRVVRESFDRAARLPSRGSYPFKEPKDDEAEREADEAGVFEMFSKHVRAAQRAGELKAGDTSLMTALIVGSVVGAADLSRYSRPNWEKGAREAEFPPLLLLDLLSTRSCN